MHKRTNREGTKEKKMHTLNHHRCRKMPHAQFVAFPISCIAHSIYSIIHLFAPTSESAAFPSARAIMLAAFTS